jgi:Mce-associated membrane protein
MTTNPTWYDILGVDTEASPEDIKAAWRAATDKFEPGSGTTQFRLFNEAADVLLDPDRRRAYDAELAGPSGEPAAETESTDEIEPTGEVPPAPAPDEAPPAPARAGLLERLAAIPVLVLAALAVVAVAAIVLTSVLAVRVHHRVQVYDAGPDASAAAERALTSVLSYDYRHMEADRDRAAQFLTPSYRKQYLKNFNDLLTKGPDGSPGPAVKTQAVVTANVLDTGVVDAESDRVRVIVFVNQSSAKGTAQPTVFQDRVVATMVHQGDKWLVDNVKSY